MENILEKYGLKIPIGSHFGKTIVFGCDHRGFSYKKEILEFLESKGFKIIDVGTFSSERCDYPIISNEIGKKISEEPLDRIGIGVCGSGIGILIFAPKHKRVYAARCLSIEDAFLTRKHNNTNLLGIGADCLDLNKAIEIIQAWLETPFYSEPDKEEKYLERFIWMLKKDEGLDKKI